MAIYKKPTTPLHSAKKPLPKKEKKMFEEKSNPGKEHEPTKDKPGQPKPGQPPHQPPQPGQPGQPGPKHLVEEAGTPPKEEEGEGESGGGGGGGGGGEEEDKEDKPPLGEASHSVAELQLEMLGGKDKIKQQVEEMTADLAEVIELKGSAYTHRGRCKKCGWQSMQLNAGDAQKMVKTHALGHWNELMAQKLGLAGGSPEHAQPEGSPLPGQQQMPRQAAPAR